MTTCNRPVTPLWIAAILALSLLMSCRTTRKVPEARLRPLDAVRLYKNAEANTFDYERFTIKRINIQFDNGSVRTSFRSSVQAVKDHGIILSLTKLNILIARVMLTPDSVVYVNYFDKTFYSGDYQPVSDLIRFDMDFNTVQAIISANVFFLFENEQELREFKTWDEEGYYVMQSETSRKLTRLEERGKTGRAARITGRMDEDIPVIQTFYFDPALFLIRKLELKDRNAPRSVRMQFSDYEPVGNKHYPAAIGMFFQTDDTSIEIHTSMSGFSTGDGEFVPIKIPENFRKVSLN